MLPALWAQVMEVYVKDLQSCIVDPVGAVLECRVLIEMYLDTKCLGCKWLLYGATNRQNLANLDAVMKISFDVFFAQSIVINSLVYMYVAPSFPKLLPLDKAVLGERATATLVLGERTIASQRLHNARRLPNDSLRFSVHVDLASGG
jgi:hypothetical protein